jgi:two-component system, sensor histidine kinase and response regulator
MHEKQRAQLIAYGVAVLATGVSLFLRWSLLPVGDHHTPFIFMAFFPAVILSAFLGGLGPGLVSTLLGAAAAKCFLIKPFYSFQISDEAEAIALGLFVLTGVVISGLTESLHRSRHQAAASERRYAVTLASIGDAVIATGDRARVTFMNRVAETLTGWKSADAIGRPITEVFHIINEETRAVVEDPAAKVLRVGTVVGLANHTALLARDGRELPIDDCGSPILEDDGRIAGVVLVFRDMTQRRRAEEAELLRRSNERLELAVRGSNMAIWEVEMPDGLVENGRVTLINAWESLGYDPLTAPTDFAGVFSLAVHPEDQERVGRAVQACLEGQTREFDVEYRIPHKDGSEHWHLTRGMVVRNPKGSPIRFIGSRVDITDLKRAEEALRKSEHRFRTFADHATDAFFLHDDKFVIVDVNRRACESLGYTRDELLGMTPVDFDPDITPARLDEIDQKLRAGEMMAFESRHRRKDGTIFPVEIRGRRFLEGGRRFSVALARDITERKRTEEALRESEQRWRSLTEALPHLVWSATPDGACDYFSMQWTEFTGVPEIHLLGWQWMEVLHPDDREPTRQLWTNAVAGYGPYDVEYRVRRTDGEYRWFKTRGVPILGSDGLGHRRDDGNVFKWFGTCTDITDLRRTEEALRESEERFRGTFENAGAGIAHTDPTGRLLRVNEKFCAIVGYPREELLQKTFQDITHPDDLTNSLGSLAVLMRGESAVVRHEKRYVRKDGSVVWVELFTSLQRDAAGQPAYAIAVVQDISERRRLDAELRRAKEMAESANRAKDEFLANVSHEIRTPMNAILGMTELALDTPLTDEQRQSLTTVKSAADNLLGIINDLLDFSKIEAGKLELDPADFSLRAALGDTLRALAVRAHRKGIELIHQVRPDVPDDLVGDAGRLRQVLLNLIGNAIKFTNAGEVEVRVEVGVEVADTPVAEQVALRFTVRDTGIGIPKDEQDRIFQAFEQEDTSTTRRYGGTGLGLTIASQLVTLMAGTITVDSEPGRGSTFAFSAWFGRRPPSSERSPTRPPVLSAIAIQSAGSSGWRLRDLPVLIVDDNATNRHILEEWLRGWRMKPAAVGDATAALEVLRQGASRGRQYTLVLLDARMPDVDGLELAGKIREDPELSATRIILLTSGDRPGDAARARELRIDAQLLKPVQQDELLGKIHHVMSREGEMPRAGANVRGQEAVPSPVPSGASLQILVAEDYEFNIQLLEQLLGRRGHRVQVARNGREALALALGTPKINTGGAFDLLLLDVHMPELDGFQVVGAIRERERTTGGHLPIIALTARSRKEDRERCLAAGMDDFLAKPIQAGELWAAIDRQVGELPGIGPSDSYLLAPNVLLAACGGDATILESLCGALLAGLPDLITAVRDSLRDGDAVRMREAAHKLCGMIGTFSTSAGQFASDLEDHAAQGQLEQARPLVAQLETIAERLPQLLRGLSLETLRERSKGGGQ